MTQFVFLGAMKVYHTTAEEFSCYSIDSHFR
jgi:hypothetical protein